MGRLLLKFYQWQCRRHVIKMLDAFREQDRARYIHAHDKVQAYLPRYRRLNFKLTRSTEA